MPSKQEIETYRNHVKEGLKLAQAEIGTHINNVDKMGDFELVELAGFTGNVMAFLDKNPESSSKEKRAAIKEGLHSPCAIFDRNCSCV
ncbi:hypothetical protein CLV51_103280 [Chitinophaga niastensis]|uniref:Uncharacterized protein n=1 Tax=Chitinophaga niastensis TaxID=536980 RepID=A0A2P8HJB1_CHINA|nr:hypothetical protein [Chitinophaga niastensis]PSL46302.1 hypothetical protein CLV51_103280 [Chitinophaga niastensis]